MSRPASASVSLVAMLSLCCAIPGSVKAFEFQTVATDNCHERMTMEALRLTGWPAGEQPPKADVELETLIKDFSFDLPEEFHNLWAVSLLVGVRHPDIRESSGLDLYALSIVHGDPTTQHEHCLRASAQDNQAGELLAVQECLGGMEENIRLALGETESITEQLDRKFVHRMALDFRGQHNVNLAVYPFRVGVALHALQDSFSHTFRSQGNGTVLGVHNWIDAIGSDFQRERDGHEHIRDLDRCEGGEGAVERARQATVASAALLEAISDTAGGTEMRLGRVQGVLEKYIAFEEGCNFDNDYCNPPELQEVQGCSAAGQTTNFWLFLIVFGFLFTRKSHGMRKRYEILLLGIYLLFVSTPAHAEGVHAAPDTSYRPISQQPLWALEARASMSVFRSAFAYKVGIRREITPRWSSSISLEHNPFFSFETGELRTGSLNFQASVRYVWVRSGNLKFSSEVGAGVSVLLFDLPGAGSGSVGPLIRWSLLQASIQLKPYWWLLLDPTEVMIPVPNVRGIPFDYAQYRVTAGVAYVF